MHHDQGINNAQRHEHDPAVPPPPPTYAERRQADTSQKEW